MGMSKMGRVLVTASALALAAGAANAGGIDRSGQSIAPLFEKGGYAELSFGMVSPSVSGKDLAIFGGRNSQNVGKDYLSLGFAYKQDINDQLSYAIIYEKPFGADLSYASVFNHTQESMFYTSCAKKLADRLGVLSAFNDSTLEVMRWAVISG